LDRLAFSLSRCPKIRSRRNVMNGEARHILGDSRHERLNALPHFEEVKPKELLLRNRNLRVSVVYECRSPEPRAFKGSCHISSSDIRQTSGLLKLVVHLIEALRNEIQSQSASLVGADQSAVPSWRANRSSISSRARAAPLRYLDNS